MDVTDSDPAFAPLCISGDDALQLGEDMDELLGEDGDWADAPGATGTMVAVLEFERGDDGGDKGPFSGPPPACAGGTAASPQESAVKAALDVLGAVTLLVLFSPMLAAICLAVMLDSPGPPIFCQTRIGWRGRDFTIYKFRTMHAHAALACRQTERGDARCTRLGAFLRRTSLDEVPQLWNVIRGDMSLVGPRPHAEALHREGPDRGDLVPWYDRRHQVKPGLTGWAQIHGARGAVRTQAEMCRRVSFDLYYIEHWSIWLDLRILARTPVIVLLGENAF